MAAAGAAEARGYGAWESPITSASITSSSIRLGGPTLEGSSVFWVEGRPAEKGRQVLVRHDLSTGATEDVTPGPDSGFNVRTRVHEYGGGAHLVAPGGGAVYFVNFADQRLYVQEVGGEPRALTPADSGLRFADMCLDDQRHRLVCVCEDHSEEGKECSNYLVAVPMLPPEDGAAIPAPTVLTSGHDFYAAPRVSPDGGMLAWVSWDHPSMPWDSTTLSVADIGADGSLSNSQVVHGGGGGVSVVHPTWGPAGSGKLYFISDADSGWWNVWGWFAGTPEKTQCVCARAGAEFAGPMWALGSRALSLLPDGRLLCTFQLAEESGATVGVLEPSTGALQPLATEFSHFGAVQACPVPGDTSRVRLTALLGSSFEPSCVGVWEGSLAGAGAALEAPQADWRILQVSSNAAVDPGYLSAPQAIEYPTEGGLTAWMIYYPPQNKDFEAPAGEKPPLLVKSHGGPTGATSTAFNQGIQYWTSRGVAVADVNYGGSTGYGREYRDRLKGRWGIVDVDDCCNAAKHLAATGQVDPERMAISGGSAGGYTTLAALAFKDVFAAGASHYGVANLEMLAGDTHKFESRYLDSLVGPYPEEKAKYQERAPINSVDTIRCPLVQFQGLEDKIVPPNQAEVMYAAVKSKGLPTALVMFEGEQHGFRQAPNIRRAMDGELFFYGKVFGFAPAMPEDFEPLTIDNL